MKKKLTLQLLDYPDTLHPFLKNCTAYDSSSHSGARVIYLDNGYYLKSDAKGKLNREATIAKWFAKAGLGVPVIHYLSTDKDYLLTKEAPGKNATYYLHEPEAICKVLAQKLKELHHLAPQNFPTSHSLDYYRKVAQDNYEKGYFSPKALLPQFGISNREEAYRLIQEKGHLLTPDALIHGDACLPNIILNNNLSFSAFIDVGLAGISDKHIDLYWAIWSLHYNLGTSKYGELFLDYYGRKNIDTEKLRLIAAFEAFG